MLNTGMKVKGQNSMLNVMLIQGQGKDQGP